MKVPPDLQSRFTVLLAGIATDLACYWSTIWQLASYREVMPRRLPARWSIDELPECFVVRDANGQALAHIYFEDEDSRRTILDRLRRNRARRIAANVAKLPAFVEAVEAKDHDEATKTAVEQFDKPMRDRFRISVRVVVRGDS